MPRHGGGNASWPSDTLRVRVVSRDDERSANGAHRARYLQVIEKIEREMRIKPATFSLRSWPFNRLDS
jgi:hypothetical protein